jgi:hypothetical protein
MCEQDVTSCSLLVTFCNDTVDVNSRRAAMPCAAMSSLLS